LRLCCTRSHAADQLTAYHSLPLMHIRLIIGGNNATL
jgi:hypothetical protein